MYKRKLHKEISSGLLVCQTGLYQEKTLADQVSVDAARELPEGEYGVLSYSYD